MTDTKTIALAALSGNATELEVLLKERASEFFKCNLSSLVNTPLLGFVTPLSCAAYSGSTACVELLLNADRGRGKLKLQFHYKHYQDTVAQASIPTWRTALGDKMLIMSPLHHAFGIDTTFPLLLEKTIHEYDKTQAVDKRFYKQPTTVFRLMFSLAQFAIWLTSKNLLAPNYDAMYAQGQAMIAQLNAVVKRDTSNDANLFLHNLINRDCMKFISTESKPRIEFDGNKYPYIVRDASDAVLTKHIDDALLLLIRMGLLPNANIAILIRNAATQGFNNTADFLKNHFPEAAKIVSTALPVSFAEYRWLFERTPYTDSKVARLYDYPKTSWSPTAATPKPIVSSSTMPVKTSSSAVERTETAALQQRVVTLEGELSRMMLVKTSSSVVERAETAALQQQVVTLQGELSRMQIQMTQMFNTLAALSQNPTPACSSSMGPSSSTVPMPHQSPAPSHYGPLHMVPQMSYGYSIPSHYSPPGSLYPGLSTFPATPASWPPPESPTFTSSTNNFLIASAPAADTPTPTLSEKQPGLWHAAPASLPVDPSLQTALDPRANPGAITLTN